MSRYGDGAAQRPSTDADRANDAWLKDVVAADPPPAHRAMVLEVGGGWFRAWCSTESRYVSARGRDKARQQYLAGAHQRENEVKDA